MFEFVKSTPALTVLGSFNLTGPVSCVLIIGPRCVVFMAQFGAGKHAGFTEFGAKGNVWPKFCGIGCGRL